MRLFVAVELPKEIKDKLYDFQLKIKPFVKAVFVHKKNLHLTLKFLGEVEEKRLDGIKNKLKNVNVRKFKVRIEGTGVFPNEKFIRIVWVGLGPEEKVIELQKKVDEELIEFSEQETRFKAHLTLARVKHVKNKKNLLDFLKNSNIGGEFVVSEFSLIKSELTKDGPRYSVVETYALE